VVTNTYDHTIGVTGYHIGSSLSDIGQEV